jgi:hypothetical protein
MKSKFKKVLTWLGLSIIMMILWIMGIAIGNLIFPSNLMEMSSDSNSSLPLFLLVCALNTGIILYFINSSWLRGWKLAGIVFLVTFGIQYFMSQIETVWFNESLKISGNGILAIVSGGVVMILIFSPVATWLSGYFKPSSDSGRDYPKWNLKRMMPRILLLSVVIWPMIYFLAGYLIAWQFDEVRLYYSDTAEMASFFSIMKDNVESGLFFFQIFRGACWILIGLLVMSAIKGSMIHKGVILGLLFAILGSSGLILPNPVMPDMVRMAHLVETAPSSFIWGLIIVWSFRVFSAQEEKLARMSTHPS